jgi:hypothetical protein
MSVSPVTAPTFGPDYTADFPHTPGITAIAAPARTTATRPYAGPRSYTPSHENAPRFAAGSLPPMTTVHTAANAYKQAQDATTQQSLAPPASNTDQTGTPAQEQAHPLPIPAHRVNESTDGGGSLDLTA